MKGLQVVTAIGGVGLAALGVLMALTNPGQDTYEQYAVEQLTTYLKDEGCTQIPSTLESFKDLLQSQCKTLVDTGQPQIQQIIANNTERQNFVLFSIYQTDLGLAPVLPNYHFGTVGVFQKFYIYQADEQ